jgi:hypothetical protein
MAWYPGATKMELQPESDDQAAIRPTQLIVHSIAGPWTAKRTYEYWRDSTNLESHFGLGYAGDLAQFIGTETRADANAAANLRSDGTGAVSIETASNTAASDKWTAEQVEQLIKLGVWLHQKHGIPLRICRTADDPGFGWHKQFTAWNPNGHACPGPARITQFREVVFPGIVARANGTTPPPEEDDMPTAAEIAAEVVKLVPKAVWSVDTLPAARPPYNNADYYKADGKTPNNVTWTAGYTQQAQVEGIRETLARVKGLEGRTAVELTDSQIATLGAAVAANPALAERIANLVATKLAERLAE